MKHRRMAFHLSTAPGASLVCARKMSPTAVNAGRWACVSQSHWPGPYAVVKVLPRCGDSEELPVVGVGARRSKSKI